MTKAYKKYKSILDELFFWFGIICGTIFTIPFFGFEASHVIWLFLVAIILIYKFIRIHFLMPHQFFDDITQWPSKAQTVSLCIGFIVGMVLISYMIDSDEHTTEQKNKEQQASAVSEVDELDEQFRSITHEDNPNMEKQKITDFLSCPKLKESPNSEYRIIEIATYAKYNINHFTDKDAKKIIKKFKSTYPDDDFLYRRKDMETYLWYGCLLAYYYPKEDARSIMGKNLVIAISSVYYDILSSLDDESQHAFKQYQNKLYQIDSD